MSKPHDRLFKLQLSNKTVAYQFFKQHLPVDLQKQVDWNTLSNSRWAEIAGVLAVFCISTG